MPSHNLNKKKIAFLATDGFEQVELTAPWQHLQDAGAQVQLIAPHTGEIQGMNHDEKGDRFQVDAAIDDVRADDFDGLVLPGGVANPDSLRTNERCVAFVRDFFNKGKPVAAICHGPWMLVEADVVRDRRLTSWPSLKTDLTNAGANWVDEPVVVDEGLVTSRRPDDLEQFCAKAAEEIAEGVHKRSAV